MSETQTAEQQEKQALSDFESGFNGKREEAPAGEQKPQAEAGKGTPEGSTAEKPTQEETPPASPIAGMTDEQIRSLLADAGDVKSLKEDLARTRDSLFGKFGELNRTIQELKQAPKGPGGKFTKDQLKRFGALNPEFADALAEDLSTIPAPSIDLDEQLNPRIEKLKEEVTRDTVLAVERRHLLRQHKDFYEQLEKPDFKLWLGQQSAEDQKEFNSSIDSDYLAGKMSAFKEFRASLDKKQDKQRRLEQAVKPQGTQVADGAKTPEQEFEEGFRGIRTTR